MASCLPDVTRTADQIPVLYGRCTDAPGFFEIDAGGCRLGLDVFGSAFFALTRYEEVARDDRDKHGRFPAARSLAVQAGMAERPIVNEYCEILWSCLHRLWPGLTRKRRVFRILPSHDVDHPFAFLIDGGVKRALMDAARALVKKSSPMAALRTVRDWAGVRMGRRTDPFDTFQWLMDLAEQANCLSAFYFKSGHTASAGRSYSLQNRHVALRMQQIIERQHELGFHPSYATMDNALLWQQEWQRLRECVSPELLGGGRQHYLRFRTPETWRSWASAGCRYESSLGYEDRIGFRCGTCYEYPVYDLLAGKTLQLRERPLLCMDKTLPGCFDAAQVEDSSKKMLRLKEICRRFGGDFTVLWHNNRLTREHQRDLYRSVVLPSG